MTSPFDRDFDQWIQSSSSGGGERPSLDGAFSNFSVQATSAAASLQGGYSAQYRHLQDQGHSDTHSSGPSYSPPPPSQAYPLQESSSFDDAPARDLHSSFGYPQEWTEGATTGVDPSQVFWAGRPSASASSSSSSSADPPLVNPSVAPSALSQPPWPQIPLPAPVHSRLDFFLQPASFTPAPHAPNLPYHPSSSTAGAPQDGPRGRRKRQHDDKENDSEYSSRPTKRTRDDEEQPSHGVPTAAVPQHILAPSMPYNTTNAAARKRLAIPGSVREYQLSRSNDHLSARHATHPANDHVRLAAGSSSYHLERNAIYNSEDHVPAAYPEYIPQESSQPGSWDMKNAAYLPQRTETSSVCPSSMGSHASAQVGGDNGYESAPLMNTSYSYHPQDMSRPILRPASPSPDARPARPDIIPPSLSRGPLRRSQRTLVPRASAVQNPTPDAPQRAQRGAAREVYPGSNSIQARQRTAKRAARRVHAAAPYPPRAPTPPPPPPPPPAETNAASSSRIVKPLPRKYPCPLLAILASNPSLLASGTTPAEHCSRATKPFKRRSDSERHFECEHLGVRYRVLRGAHRGCRGSGSYSRRDAIRRHVRDCRTYPGATAGVLGVYMPCWNASAWRRACGGRERRERERGLGKYGVLVYECECCRVGGAEPEGAGAQSRARTPEATPMKIKEEEVDEAGVLYRSGSQPHSDAAYESEEDTPCTAMATAGCKPQITQEQTSDGHGGSVYFPNDPWIGFWGEDSEAGTDSDASGSEHASDIGGCAAVQTEDSGSHMSDATSPSAPSARNQADDLQASPWETLANPGPIQDTFTNAWDGLFSDDGEYDADADADGNDSETDAGLTEELQQNQPAGLVEPRLVARERSSDVPLRFDDAAAAVADTSRGQSEATSSDSTGPSTPTDAGSQWGVFDFWSA